MQRSRLIVGFVCFLFLGPGFGHAQESAALASPVPEASPQTPPPAKEKGPVGVISGGYIYIASEVGPGMPWQFHLHGFYGIPQVNIKPWFGVIGDFTKSYNTSAGAHENTDSFLCGPIFTARSSKKIGIFGFADAGKLRDSKNGTVTSTPIFATGGGFTMKLNKHIGLLFVPGEYIRNYAAAGDLNNFTARFGFTIPLNR